MDLDKLCVLTGSPIQLVVEMIDASAARGCFVTDDSGKLVGLVTDGDLRRALLRGTTLADPVEAAMNANITTTAVGTSKDDALRTMLRLSISHLPVVTPTGKLTSVFLLSELIKPPRRNNVVVIMAGGRGTRLGELTIDTPKPMLEVQGRPMLEVVLLNCLEYGFTRFVFCVHYLSKMIEDYFGDGSTWGAHIEYVREGEPLGTSGGLRLISPPPQDTFFVLNADVINRVDLAQLLEIHESSGALATMCVRRQIFRLPYGLVNLEDTRVSSITEKPDISHFVNAGIYVLEPDFLNFVPENTSSDMTDVLNTALISGRQVQAFPIFEFWMDLGDHDSLHKANALVP